MANPRSTSQTLTKEETLIIDRLELGSIKRRASGWWGVLMLIATEAFLFIYLLFSYYYFAIQHGRAWLPAELPKFHLSGPSTAILILSSVAVWWGEKGVHKNSRTQLSLGLFIGIVLGALFVGIQIYEWSQKPFTMDSDSYGSLYFVITGFHLAHVLGGLLILVALLVWGLMGYFDKKRESPVTIGAAYWHFVDVVWLTVFFTFYITPYLG